MIKTKKRLQKREETNNVMWMLGTLFTLLVLIILFSSLTKLPSAGLFVAKTIAVDGDFSDWNSVIADPENNVYDGPWGSLTDLDDPNIDDRDLTHFASTWDEEYIYFNFERVDSAAYVGFFVYVDKDNDGFMEENEPVIYFKWPKNSKKYRSYIYKYDPYNPGGDTMDCGDGCTMPGTKKCCSGVYLEEKYGASNNYKKLEARIKWDWLNIWSGYDDGRDDSISSVTGAVIAKEADGEVVSDSKGDLQPIETEPKPEPEEQPAEEIEPPVIEEEPFIEEEITNQSEELKALCHQTFRPTDLQFHISSSQGPTIPENIVDNMGKFWLVINITPSDTNPPSITLLAPPDNSIDNNGVIRIRYEVTDASDVAFCELIVDGLVYQNDTTIQKSVEQTFITTAGLVDGNYTFSINCTDEHSNEGSSATRAITVKIPPGAPGTNIAVNETIDTYNGTNIYAKVEYVDCGSNVVDYNLSGEIRSGNICPGTYTIKITILNHSIEEVLFVCANLTSQVTKLIDIDDPAETDKFISALYALDASKTNFTYEYINVTLTAKGRSLYKCSNWNYEDQLCIDDRWKRILDTVPGQRYTITIYNSSDPGFGEANNTINLLDKDDFLVNNNQTILGRSGDLENVNIVTEDHTIKDIVVYGHNYTSFHDDLYLDEPADTQDLVNLYAIDTIGLDFTNATATILAEGGILYKCPDWSFTTGTCPAINRDCTGTTKNDTVCAVYGGWQRMQRLPADEGYTITITPGDPGFGEYNSTYGAPYCPTGESPCVANSSLLKCRDNVNDANGPEPSWPNTIDTCTDGTSTWETPSCGRDESVENITITDLNNSYFYAGDVVKVEAWVHCWTSNNAVALVYTNNTIIPQWKLLEYRACPADPFDTYHKETFSNFTLDNVAGDHAVRVYVQYLGESTETCADSSGGNGQYDDNDDVVFFVRESNGTVQPPGNIFFDNFESGNLSTKGWYTYGGTTNNWVISTVDPYQGTDHAQAQNTDSNAILAVNISTDGFVNITVSYYRRLIGIDPSDEFSSSWFNGTANQTMEQTGSGSANDPTYLLRTYDLGASADNNANFKLYFLCYNSWFAEYCRLDNVVVSGVDIQAPRWSSQSQNTSTPGSGESVLLSAYWTDNAELSQAILATNETGTWQNYTGGTYGSPLALSGDRGWSNFTWQNPSIANGTVVSWRIWAKDTSGNWNVTGIMSFTVGIVGNDTTPPVITNITTDPVMPFNKSDDEQNITINFTSSEYPINITFNLYNSTGGLVDTQGPTQVNNASELPVNYTIPAGLPDGTYTLNMTAVDSYNNSVTITIGTFTIDGTPPTITIVNPKSKTYIVLNLILDTVASADSQNCWYSLNAGMNTSFTCNAPVNITAIEGSNTVIVYANDSVGNIGSDNVVFNVNTSLVLSIDITAPLNGSMTNDPTPDITLLAIDKVYAAVNYTVYIYYENGTLYSKANTGVLNNNTATTIALWPALALIGSNTTYKILATANDSAPNYANSTYVYIILKEPVVYLLSPANGYTDADGDINFTFKYVSSNFATANCSLYINSIYNQRNETTSENTATMFTALGISDGQNQNWTVSCSMDGITVSDTRIFNVDMTPPGTITNLISPMQGENWITWIWDNPPDADFYQNIIFINGTNVFNTSNDYYNATGLISNTSYTITVHTKDLYGNVNNTNVSDTNKTLPSPIAPTISNVTIQSITNNSAQILWNTDKLANSTVTYWTKTTNATKTDANFVINHTINLSGLSAGTLYKFTVTSCDQVGNCVTVGIFNFTTLKNPSNCFLVFNPLSPKTYGTPVNASCSCTNPEASAKLWRNGIDVTAIENNIFTILAAQTHNYVCNVSATQNYTAANASAAYIINKATGMIYLYLNGSRADFTTPEDQYVNISAILITGTGNIQVYKNGTLIYNGPSPSENITLFDSPGLYNITAAYSGNQNYTADTETWWVNATFVDNTPPVITNITTDPNTPFINNGSEQNITINFTSSEYPINITFNLYNSTGGLVDTQGPTQVNNASELPVNYTIPAGLPDGTYTLNMTAVDSYNNSVTVTIGTFTVDTTPPVISNVAVISITHNSAKITWLTNELANSLVNYGTNTSLGTNVSNANYVINHNIPLSGLSPSTTYYFNITSCDQGGNCNTSAVYSFTTTAAPNGGGGGGGGGVPTGLITCNNNGICEPGIGETHLNCPGDCPPIISIGGITKTIHYIGNFAVNDTFHECIGFNELWYFTYKEVNHSVEQIRLAENSVRLEINSEPIYLDLLVKQSKQIDVDRDGVKDVIFTLNSIRGKTPTSECCITLSLPKAVPEAPLWQLVAALGIAFLFFIIFARRRKKEKKKKKRKKSYFELKPLH